jgi:hypothetical protein
MGDQGGWLRTSTVGLALSTSKYDPQAGWHSVTPLTTVFVYIGTHLGPPYSFTIQTNPEVS